MGADGEADSGTSVGVKSNSKAFALLMHSMGFSIFLLYFTGQMRWFLINGVVGMLMLWIFNETGLDNRWAVISTHSIGYFILALVVVSSILVFGGVVLVWSHLIEFLMNIITRYPEVKDEIRQERILEQVLVRYLANMPHTEVLHRPDDFIDEEAALTGDHQSRSSLGEELMVSTLIETPQEAEASNVSHVNDSSCGNNSNSNTDAVLHRRYHSTNAITTGAAKEGYSNDAALVLKAEDNNSNKKLSRVLEAKKPNSCFFCSKHEPVYLLPACSGWTPRPKGDISGILPMCTPYSELAHTRNALNVRLSELNQSSLAESEENNSLRTRIVAAESLLTQVRQDSDKQITLLRQQVEELMQAAVLATRQREIDIGVVITQHNTQLTEVKRLYKKLQSRQRVFLAHHQAAAAAGSAVPTEELAPIPLMTEIGEGRGGGSLAVVPIDNKRDIYSHAKTTGTISDVRVERDRGDSVLQGGRMDIKTEEKVKELAKMVPLRSPHETCRKLDEDNDEKTSSRNSGGKSDELGSVELREEKKQMVAISADTTLCVGSVADGSEEEEEDVAKSGLQRDFDK